MSAKIYIISDLHFGHKNILNFSGDYRLGTTIEEHDEWLVDCWNSIVTKRDVIYCLGDVAWSREALKKCARLNGNKYLIMGNHDKFRVDEYAEYFQIRPGIYKYKGYWLSHAPIHPDELRGIQNIHGHVHHKTIEDDRYINACVEAVGGVPMKLPNN